VGLGNPVKKTEPAWDSAASAYLRASDRAYALIMERVWFSGRI